MIIGWLSISLQDVDLSVKGVSNGAKLKSLTGCNSLTWGFGSLVATLEDGPLSVRRPTEFIPTLVRQRRFIVGTHDIISIGGRCVSGSVFDATRGGPFTISRGTSWMISRGSVLHLGFGWKIVANGAGRSLTNYPTRPGNSWRPVIGPVHGAEPQTTVGAHWGPDSFLFCIGHHCRRHSQLLLGLLTAAHSTFERVVAGHPLKGPTFRSEWDCPTQST